MVFTKYEKAIGIIKMDQLDEMMEYEKRIPRATKDGKKSNVKVIYKNHLPLIINIMNKFYELSAKTIS